MKKWGAVLLLVAASSAGYAQADSSKAQSQLPSRSYKEGEIVRYRMNCRNKGRSDTITYTIQSTAVVKKDQDGKYYEETAWSDMTVNGNPFPMPASSQTFRQVLTLDPASHSIMPDLGKVQPILIGPITDLLTFYADVFIAHKDKLEKPGDHFYFKRGTPASWADGHYVTLGQSSIDFDVTFQSVDEAKKTATLLVRHVPPAVSQITTPAAWMKTPVVDTPNNWVLVNHGQNGKYTAAVGKETFDITIQLSLGDGRILSASMVNPVQVMERECNDEALSDCGQPVRYEIRRDVDITALP